MCVQKYINASELAMRELVKKGKFINVLLYDGMAEYNAIL